MYARLVVAILLLGAVASPVYAERIPGLEDLKAEFREGLLQLKAITDKSSDMNKKKFTAQVMVDGPLLIHKFKINQISFETADKEAKKLKKIGEDHKLLDKEMADWNKDMRSVLKR